MLKTQVIGLGAAGNKAAITLKAAGVISADKMLLVNSTEKDIPEGYKAAGGKYSIIGDGIGGCGQERSKGRDIAFAALQNGSLNLDSFVLPDTELIVLITSTEGGTGSGSSVVVAKYLSEVLKQNVVVFAITGFEQSARAIWNTIEFFKDMQDDYHIEILRNKKFLADVRNNQLKAEQAANNEFVDRYKILVGLTIHDAEQNIDSRDLKKLSTEAGWGNIEFRHIDEKIKNTQQFNDIINDMIDETKSFDVAEGSQKRLGVIVSLSEKEQDAIDYSFQEIIAKYGNPYELYKHIQVADDDTERYIAFISTGMHLPLDELEVLYNEANKASEKVVKEKDDFFSKIQNLNRTDEDSMFDLKEKKGNEEQMKAAKQDFFSNFKSVSTPAPTEKKEERSAQSVRAQAKADLEQNY